MTEMTRDPAVAASQTPWTRLAEPAHREGCKCPPHELSRCYPCRATGEVLMGDQWRAMEVYRDVNWRGYRLVEAVKQELEYHARLAKHPECRRESYREPTDEQLGENAIHSWFEYSPADLVKAIRHCESEAHEGSDCEPAYDDPECLVGKCRHIECDRQRSYERLCAAAAESNPCWCGGRDGEHNADAHAEERRW